MTLTIATNVGADPRRLVLDVEAAVRAICEATEMDPAEGVMMLLTAAAHMSRTYTRPEVPVAQRTETLATALGAAIVAADDFFTPQIAAEGAASGKERE